MSEEMEQWIQEMLRVSDADDRMTDKQIKIINAAVETFSAKGFAGSSTSEIAQKAGVAEGTIFRHYKTKKDLLISIVAPTMAKLIAPFVLKDFNKVLHSNYPNYEDFLRAVIRNRLEFVRNNLPIIKIMLHEIPFHAELQTQFKEHVGKKVFQRVKEIVEHFQKEEQIVSVPSTTVIRHAISVIIGFFLARFLLLPELDWNEEQEINYSIDFIMHGLAPRNK
ncbi:MAG: transcriptional regulator, TetR family [Bacilli bacterium]|nr:transcriptional regulator, TetR family [Bacilli bacterium]